LNFFYKNKFIPLLIAAILFAAAHFLHHPVSEGSSSAIQDFESVLHKKEERLNAEMFKLAKLAEAHNYSQLFIHKPDYYNDLLKNDGLALLIYENDTLKFWSDNSIAVENWIKEVCLDAKTAKLRNGWFEVVHPQTNSTTTKTIVGLILIKNEFPYQNKYLTNEFQKDFPVPDETKLITNNPGVGNVIKNIDNDYLFSLEFSPAGNSVSTLSYLAIVFNLIGFVFVVLFFRIIFLRFPLSKNNYVLLFLAAIISLRYLTIKLSFPQSFYVLDLFSPAVYADASSIWLSSLGDLLINIVLLFYLTFFFFKEFDFNPWLNRLKKNQKILFTFFVFLCYFWFSWIITNLFSGLIQNSNIPFGINNLFSLNQYSYIGIIIFGLLLFIYFLFAEKIITILKGFGLSDKEYIGVFFIATAIHFFASHFLGILDLIIVLWPFILLASIAVIRKNQPTYPFSGVVFLVFVFSLYAVHVLVKHTESKEKESRKIYAEKLAAEQDPVAELLFEDVEKKINRDTILLSYVNSPTKQPAEFEKRIKQQYFSGFWGKYDVRVALFDSTCAPIIKSQNAIFDNTAYFDDLIAGGARQTSSEHFYFLNSSSGKISYLAKIPLHKNQTSKFGTLYIELDAKFISDEIGFPELLLDRNIGLSQELTNYSYAKYKHNQLINQYGKFPYSLTSGGFNIAADSWSDNFSFISFDHYDHLLFRADPQTLVVLSKRSEGLIGQVTTFSYLFSFFSLLLLLILFFRQISTGGFLENFSFKYRIQIFLVFIVLSSLALFGGGTIYYIKQQFETKNKENISEKIHSVLIDIEGKLTSEKALTESLSEYVSFLLKKSSSVFFTDINFYNTNGDLYSSSSSKVFDEGLTSKKMNPEAFLQMAVLGKTEFIHDERIGKLEYLSAYIPFKNNDGKLLAYINLPYFAKQSELEKEISGFLVALINIYVLLFALSIISAILISNYVTKPLKLIQDKLKNIRLGKTNEPIEWKENDEIGSLVSEYNRMISELSKSAELLAKSERETAWREMAKQVAHEIKNPLTPMKLSIQHLQRTYKDHAPDMDEKMERLTKTIVEQIDTLSSIATEFSNFANMPKASFEAVDLSKILQNVIDLYKNSASAEMVFINNTADEAFILADKEQLIRAFNNLLKNAVQAIPENKKGLIKIELSRENGFFLVSIADNGTGISEDVLDKIFVPNFTTKTGGMGLGLAMVKSIVETTNGRIWFETGKDSGTTFYISIPAIQEG
jgi:two-component system, NtrC family, nitrogen regulation sensor histidine kinase NtrY